MNTGNKHLPFLEHLEELRSRIIKSLLAVTVCAVVAYEFSSDVLRHLIHPVGNLIFTSPPDAFLAIVNVTLFSALLLAFPFLGYQIWAFIATALTPAERRYVFIFAPISLILFLIGALFGYVFIVPISLKFLLSFSRPWLTPMIAVNQYISFVGTFVLSFGIVFELPLMVVFLTKIGIASPEFLRQKRKYAVVFIFIVSAILTPPDCMSQLLMAIPLVILYELGIFLCKMIYPKN